MGEIIRTETLGNMLLYTLSLTEDIEGWYSIYIPKSESNIKLSEIILSTLTYSDFSEDESNDDSDLELLADIWLVQDIVNQALEQKPNANKEELVNALEYYLYNDAYITY